MSLPLTHEIVQNRPSGRTESTVEPMHASSARQVAHLNAVLDEARSEQYQAENESRRLAQRLQALMDALPAAVVVLDGYGRVQECNPAAESLLGASLRGRLWRELIQELFLPEDGGGDALSLRSGRLVTLSTRPLESEPGQVLMLQDVTESHQMSNRLEQFRRLADMGRMAASLAHQIRTPLSSALLYVSQLSSARLDEAKRERFAGKAMQSLKGLEQLINDMLLFVNGGRAKRESLRPTDLLAEMGDEMKRLCESHSVVLSIEPGEAAGAVMVNRTLVKSALQNLVNNAIEAGAARIRLGAGCQEGACAFVVSDDGPGVEPAQQQRIFEPFVSGRSAGTGLGLAVVKAVANAMGGDVALYSVAGEGATFAIHLPLHSRQADDAAVKQE